MKVKGNERILLEEDEALETVHEHEHDQDNIYKGGVLKIKTAIGKIRKKENSQYKPKDPKRFNK